MIRDDINTVQIAILDLASFDDKTIGRDKLVKLYHSTKSKELKFLIENLFRLQNFSQALLIRKNP